VQQWEYLVEISGETDSEKLQQWLNTRGTEGWELAASTVVLGGWHSGTVRLCFKRPKSPA
jgi:hypothetical protein